MRLSRLILRLLIGGLFIGHGTQKLFGWFGGHGPEATAGFFDSLGLRPGRHNAIAAGVAEAGSGALLVTGLATPVAGAALTATMSTAIRHVHASKGPWVSNGGWEYNAVLIAATLAVVEAGPGPLSLDHMLGTERSGTGVMLAAAAAGAAGSFAASEYAKRQQKEADFAGVPFHAAEEQPATEDATKGAQTTAG
jgi:putative oxidoreductase